MAFFKLIIDIYKIFKIKNLLDIKENYGKLLLGNLLLS